MIACTFSPCRRYRYTWEHTWNPSRPPCAFIGLNPSTADEEGPDPTVRRCIGYALDWGYGKLIMLNLFAFRATDPTVMKAESEPVGVPYNNRTLREVAGYVRLMGGIVVAAWGNHGAHQGRSAFVRDLLAGVPLYHLTLTKAGEPGHPLYLRADLRPKLLHSGHEHEDVPGHHGGRRAAGSPQDAAAKDSGEQRAERARGRRRGG